MIKLTISDLAKSVSNEQVKHMLCDVYKITLTTEIKMGQHRDDDGKLSYMLNYDRYVWVHPDQLIIPLPRNAQCGIFKCRIFHKGQFKQSEECFNCFANDHQKRNCPNPRGCKVCKTPGHLPGSPMCRFYTTNHGIRVFGGYKDPMSNHFPCEFVHDHIKVKSSEHSWFHKKAMRHGQKDLANMILDADTALDAKILSKGIRVDRSWDNSEDAYNIMKDILRDKFTDCKEPRDALYECWLKQWSIVEAVHANHYSYWGTGLSKEATIHTVPEAWTGTNRLGKILTELSIEFWGEPEYEDGWENGEEEQYGFMDYSGPPSAGVPVDTVPDKATYASRLEEVDGFDTNDAKFHRGHKAEQTHYNRNRARGRGSGPVRGGRGGGRGQYSGGMPHKQPSPRTPAEKRDAISPLQNSMQKKPNVVIAPSRFDKSTFKPK